MKKIYTILVCIWLLAGFVACEKDKDFALTTLTVQNETITPSYGSATIDCSFKSDATISEAFVQYSLSSSFAKYDVAKMTEEKGKYAAQLTGLADNTTYYIRYAVSNKYSSVVTTEVKAFTTDKQPTSDPSNPSDPAIELPTVTTSVATQITATTAVTGGNVTNDGGAEVTERGVCIATVTNPTTSNSKVSAGSGTGSFTFNLTNLQPNTTYYVRAYAVNSQGTAYGEEVSFTTKVEVVDNPSSNLRTMPFSVSESKQVYFSKGNLQYHPANDEWRFAENQTDYIGDANSNCSSTYYGWLDLFGWSTKGNNFGVSTSTSSGDYSGSFVDWGTNQIGGDVPNTWRTLTYNEWEYLLNTRTNATSLKGVAQVNGVNGLILLPDNWTCPAGVTFKSGFHSNYGVDYYAAYQTFTVEQWSKFEAAGAIFLPAAGGRTGSVVSGGVQFHGYYWSAPEYGSSSAYSLGFYSDEAHMFYANRYYGRSVRLVKDL